MVTTLRSACSAKVVKGELLAIVFLVRPVKHLSRESRKLTVMVRRELVSYLVTKYKSLAISSVLYEGLASAQSRV